MTRLPNIEYLQMHNLCINLKMAGDFSLPSNFEILNKMFSLHFILGYRGHELRDHN